MKPSARVTIHSPTRAQLPPGTGIFSSTCFLHCLTGHSEFYQVEVHGVTARASLEQWYFEGQPSVLIDTCRGWPCTNICGASRAHKRPSARAAQREIRCG